MTKPTGLAEPLAAAIEEAEWEVGGITWRNRTDEENGAMVCRGLRSDPQTLAVIAEALHEVHGGPAPWPGPMTSLEFAARLADALFGAPQ